MSDKICDDLWKAVVFLKNITVQQQTIWTAILENPGQEKEKIVSSFGLSSSEFESIMKRLFEISFILEQDGKIFPTKYGALMVEGHKEAKKLLDGQFKR
jgi:predicted transcriptional regulator